MNSAMLGICFRAVCLVIAVGLGGCHGLTNVRYDKSAALTSSRSAEVRLVSGIVSGEPYPVLIGPLLIPVPTSPSSPLSFSVDDQRTFVLSLVEQLNRLKILNASESTKDRSEDVDVSIQITFMRTDERNLGTSYELEVEMLLSLSGQSAIERYSIISSEGQSNIQLFFTRPAEAKERAANKLMAAVIPDIEKFLLRRK
jgi:predicted DNA-binding WGR domain protein